MSPLWGVIELPSVGFERRKTARFIQDNQDPNTRGSGVFFVQTPSEFTVPPPGGYAIGTFGADLKPQSLCEGRRVQVGPSGSVPSGTEDLNDDGTLLAGTIAASSIPESRRPAVDKLP